MRVSLVISLVAWGLGVLTGAETIRFDSTAPGSLPPGWIVPAPYGGAAPRWEIRTDSTAPSKPNVLAQVSANEARETFPMAILDTALYKDGEVSVKFKTVSGRAEQAAGLVWRYRDPKNYYLVRANSLQHNIVMFRVENGRHIMLAPKGKPPRTYGVQHRIASRTWNILKVTFKKGRFEVYYDHRKVFEVEDGAFAQAGKVGLWTRPDSVTYFD